MSIRKKLEDLEYKILHEKAQKSRESRGRRIEDSPCPIRTEFQRDRDRIIHSKAFRRLKHKTQVFLQPEGDHYRTRLTHTLEVSQIARTIARALFLNEDLVEAIALGHDLGHTPFGHTGEAVLSTLLKNYGGFYHPRQSLRVVDILEKDGRGLNLTEEVRDGILKHSKGFGEIIKKDDLPFTLEGQIVRISDIIAYINHDLDDAIRAKVLRLEDVPEHLLNFLGRKHSERISSMVMDVIEETRRRNYELISLSDDMEKAIKEMRDFLKEKVYFSPTVKKEAQKARGIIEFLFNYYVNHPHEIPFYDNVRKRLGDYPPHTAAADYIAGMTDRFAIKIFEEKFIPRSWAVI